MAGILTQLMQFSHARPNRLLWSTPEGELVEVEFDEDGEVMQQTVKRDVAEDPERTRTTRREDAP